MSVTKLHARHYGGEGLVLVALQGRLQFMK